MCFFFFSFLIVFPIFFKNLYLFFCFLCFDGSIEDEYVREFIGEGQLFWYYKRKGITEIPRLYNRSAGDMKIELSNYQFDLPDKELAERE